MASSSSTVHRPYNWLAAILLAALLSAPAVAADEAGVSVAQRLDRAAGLLATGQAAGALAELEAVEQVEPSNPWMWFYRGTAYQQLRQPHEAMRCHDRALTILTDLGNPDPALAGRIQSNRAEARRQVFNLSYRVGVAYDTNVSYLGDQAVDVAGLISGDEDTGFGSEFRLDYAAIADETNTLVFGTRLGHLWYCELSEFDYQDYGAYVSYAHRVTPNLEPGLRYDYDMVLLGNDGFLSNHALTPNLTWHYDMIASPVRPESSSVYYQFEGRDFLFETLPEFDRDGTTHGVGFEQRFQANPLGPHPWDLLGGYRLTSIHTDGTEFDRLTHDFYVGLGIPLVNPAAPAEYLLIPDKELVFRFDVQWHIADYSNDSLIDNRGRRRKDHITTYAWTITQTLMDDPTWGLLELTGLIHWTDARSNVRVDDTTFPGAETNPFTYDKVVYGMQLAWQW